MFHYLILAIIDEGEENCILKLSQMNFDGLDLINQEANELERDSVYPPLFSEFKFNLLVLSEKE